MKEIYNLEAILSYKINHIKSTYLVISTKYLNFNLICESFQKFLLVFMEISYSAVLFTRMLNNLNREISEKAS